MTKQTSFLLSLLLCIPLSVRAMDTQLKQLLQEMQQDQEAVLRSNVKQLVNRHQMTDTPPLACQHMYQALSAQLVFCIATQPFQPLQRVMGGIDAFIKSEELKELAGPVSQTSDHLTALEKCAWYLQNFSTARELLMIRQLNPENDPFIHAIKLGSRIITLRKNEWARHGIKPNQHYLELIEKAYAHLVTPL
jgi:hypothetical protein